MAIQYSEALRNARLSSDESVIGTTPILEIRSGSVPANCAASDTGTVLATLNLPSDWQDAPSAGAATLLGTWEDATADATGTAGHFRMKDSGGTTCHIQGDITLTGGGGVMEVNNTSLVAGQPFTVTTFTRTVHGA